MNDEYTREIYDRMSDESTAAFKAFCTYRDLHPLERSIPRVESLVKRPVSSWARQYEWYTRVEAWDEHVDRAKRVARMRMFERREEAQIEALGAYQDLTHANIELWQELQINGPREDSPVPVMTIQDLRLSLESIVKLNRLINDQATEVIAKKDAPKKDLSKLTTQELLVMREVANKLKE